MTRTRLLLTVCFCAAFAAGVAAGLAWPRRHGRPPRGSLIANELGLTAKQREQMRRIWSEAMDALRGQHSKQRRELREARDAAVVGLLTEEQKERYHKILSDYEADMEAIGKARKAAFEDAVKRTKEILTEPQRKKYEEMLKKRSSGRRHWGRRRRRDDFPKDTKHRPPREGQGGGGGRDANEPAPAKPRPGVPPG